MTETMGLRVIALSLAMGLIVTACGGGDDDASTSSGTILDDVVVIDPDELPESVTDPDEAAPEPEAEVATAGDTDLPATSADGDPEDPDADEIEVAEAEEDELDGLLNSLNVFNSCIADRGFTLDGFPGDGTGRAAADFDSDYLAALGACAAESGIQDAAASFGESQANLTPEEIEQNNFGLPVFKECMEDLGWVVDDLVPDERGALGFGTTGTGLTPPNGGGIGDLNTDDINKCRREAEQHVADNFVPDEA